MFYVQNLHDLVIRAQRKKNSYIPKLWAKYH